MLVIGITLMIAAALLFAFVRYTLLFIGGGWKEPPKSALGRILRKVPGTQEQKWLVLAGIIGTVGIFLTLKNAPMRNRTDLYADTPPISPVAKSVEVPAAAVREIPSPKPDTVMEALSRLGTRIREFRAWSDSLKAVVRPEVHGPPLASPITDLAEASARDTTGTTSPPAASDSVAVVVRDTTALDTTKAAAVQDTATAEVTEPAIEKGKLMITVEKGTATPPSLVKRSVSGTKQKEGRKMLWILAVVLVALGVWVYPKMVEDHLTAAHLGARWASSASALLWVKALEIVVYRLSGAATEALGLGMMVTVLFAVGVLIAKRVRVTKGGE